MQIWHERKDIYHFLCPFPVLEITPPLGFGKGMSDFNRKNIRGKKLISSAQKTIAKTNRPV